MLFALIAKDKPNSGEIRAVNRPRHLEYLKASSESVRLAGPLLDENDLPIGALIILEASDLEEAKRWAADDPYARAGLFHETLVLPWKFGMGKGFSTSAT